MTTEPSDQPKSWHDLIADLAQEPHEGATTTVRGLTLTIVTGKDDQRGAELLQWAYARWPDITNGELIDALQQALWWHILRCGIEFTPTLPQPPAGGDS